MIDPEKNPEFEIGESAISPQKQAIINVAQDLFAQLGYDGLSIRDLAEHCGLAKATIYHHFQDKQDIFLSVLAQDMLNMHARTMQAAQDVPDSLERLRVVIRTYCELMGERRSLILPIIHTNPEMANQARRFVQQHKQLFLGPLVEIIQQCADAGTINPVDSQLSAVCLLGMVNAVVTYRIIFSDIEYGGDVADYVLNLFIDGIGVNTS